MSAAFRAFVQSVTPPVLFNGLMRLRGLRYGFHGSYPSYAAALRDCHTPSAFSSERIIETVTRKALEGSDTPQMDLATREQQLLAAAVTPLLACAESRQPRVLDFGGGLGADFRRMRAMLPAGWHLSWEVLETEPMARAGQTQIGEDGLRFFSDWEDARGPYDLVLASSSIQYTPDPVETFERLTARTAAYMIINRLPLIPGSRDRLTVQRVPPSYYDASYPAWFLAEESWLPRIERDFVIRRGWDVPEDYIVLDGRRVMNRGLLLERRYSNAA